MNGRLYDPVVGKMLSPDPFVQASDLTQSYNRYSYAWNNPLKYADPTGMLIAPTLDDEVGGFNLGSLARMFSGTTRGWDKSLHDEASLSYDWETGQYYVRGAIPVSTNYAMNVANSMAKPMTVGDLIEMINGTSPSQSVNLGPEIASLDGGPETKKSDGEKFSLTNMYLHFQFGEGKSMTLNMSSFDFSGTSQKELGLLGMKPGDKRGVNLFNAGTTNPAALAFGRVNMMYYGNNQFSIVSDESSRFDFNPIIDCKASWGRNAGNILGTMVNYNFFPGAPFSPLTPSIFGGPYNVKFIGTTYIPK